MARRAVIERDELFEAASSMAAEGKDVTALALLNALGGGSLTTIYKYLAEWESGRPKTTVTAGTGELPDAVQNAFMNTWRIASMEAARETAAVREKAAEEIKAAQKQFEGALEAIQRLEAESETDATEIDALKQRVAELEAAVLASSNENAALKATGEQLRHQVKSQQAELERLHKDRDADRKAHQDELAKVRGEFTAYREKTDAEIQRLQEQLGEAHKKAELADRERKESALRAEQSEKQTAEMVLRLKSAEDKLDAATADREKVIKEAAELRGEANTLRIQNGELIAKLAERPLKKDKKDE